ncbi:MAG: MerR family transcriptional regulator [Endozoicomonas sp.]|uniref:MerR family transcriptional regulator n=1 Tax=Endozoicomonas sp. TaxID=1892382 RepID=UPI003D9BD9D7
MKLFRIGEISRLYDISVDTLRHYEKRGLLEPEQISESGYRYYSNRQIWRLNTIRTLRQLDVSLADIHQYMSDRSLASSACLIDFQLDTIKQKMADLEVLQEQLESRKHYFSEVETIGCHFEIQRLTLPARTVESLDKKVTDSWELDRTHKEIEAGSQGQKFSYFAQGRAGATISQEDFLNAQYDRYSSMFILDTEGSSFLAEGEYLCAHFRGEYANAFRLYPAIRRYMQDHGLELSGSVVEIYQIDIHETDDENEFLTEIQVPVRSKQKEKALTPDHSG